MAATAARPPSVSSGRANGVTVLRSVGVVGGSVAGARAVTLISFPDCADEPTEFVAVNLEYFLLDPAYACRRPALYGYFAVELGSLPPRSECAPDLVYLQVGSDASQPPVLQLGSERVYAVDYLFAEGNDRPMSRWGHSMLRLVICAPGRAPGPDCRLDQP